MDIINKKYQNNDYLRLLAYKMRSMNQVKYLILDDFLDVNFYKHLMDEILSGKNILVGDTAGRQIYYVAGSYSEMFWKFYLGPHMRDLLEIFYGPGVSLEGLKGGKNALQKFLNIVARKKGMFLRKNMPDSQLDWHTDGPQSKIAGSFILYLNLEWSSNWGGNLELGENTREGIRPYISVTPIGNRCILIMCDENTSWHRVIPVNEGHYRQFIHDQILYFTT